MVLRKAIENKVKNNSGKRLIKTNFNNEMLTFGVSHAL